MNRFLLLSISILSFSQNTFHSWDNLCNRSGRKGLVARFGFNGVPAFVLLSPEGKVLSKRIGYGKGIIDWWLEKFIGASYTRVEK